MRILVVEDHQAMREIVTGHLRDRGFAADGVKRADEALAAAATIDYDAVILDLGLPDADGMEGALSRELNWSPEYWRTRFRLRPRWRLATSGRLPRGRRGACGGRWRWRLKVFWTAA